MRISILPLVLLLVFYDVSHALAADAFETARAVVDGRTLQVPIPEGYQVLPEDRPEYKQLRDSASGGGKGVVTNIFVTPDTLRFFDGDRTVPGVNFVVCYVEKSTAWGISWSEYDALKSDTRSSGEGAFLAGFKNGLQAQGISGGVEFFSVAHEGKRYFVASFVFPLKSQGVSIALAYLPAPLNQSLVHYIYFSRFGSVDPSVSAPALKALGDQVRNDAERWERLGLLRLLPDQPGPKPSLAADLGRAAGPVVLVLVGVVWFLRRRKASQQRQDSGHGTPGGGAPE